LIAKTSGRRTEFTTIVNWSGEERNWGNDQEVLDFRPAQRRALTLLSRDDSPSSAQSKLQAISGTSSCRRS
jgi:hypothetical protein